MVMGKGVEQFTWGNDEVQDDGPIGKSGDDPFLPHWVKLVYKLVRFEQFTISDLYAIADLKTDDERTYLRRNEELGVKSFHAPRNNMKGRRMEINATLHVLRKYIEDGINALRSEIEDTPSLEYSEGYLIAQSVEMDMSMLVAEHDDDDDVDEDEERTRFVRAYVDELKSESLTLKKRIDEDTESGMITDFTQLKLNMIKRAEEGLQWDASITDNLPYCWRSIVSYCRVSESGSHKQMSVDVLKPRDHYYGDRHYGNNTAKSSQRPME